MALFFKTKKIDEQIPNNFATKCPKCEQSQFTQMLNTTFNVCPNCNHNMPRTSREVVTQIVDENSFKELYVSRRVFNPLKMAGYAERQKALKEKLDVDEAVICGTAKVEGVRFAIAVMDTRFLMGSLGTRAGEKITLLVEFATKKNLPLIIFTASGGARMQDGILSLMQMSKIVSSLKVHSNKGLFYMPVLMNPTTGGVSASFAQLGDVIIAEDNALICFAGPKVIEKTINQKLPDGFQKSEFLLEHGFLDAIVKRSEQRAFIAKMLKWHGGKNE
ncbi:acetyl-CoA carboxylase carboxyltransferase subunit beta [Mollicutes bacterium LVI A0039]|nr:acetyl-CoA carboxylase carboxyltransferase subunit beta [Mollicutes bacterium LVI A0039]